MWIAPILLPSAPALRIYEDTIQKSDYKDSKNKAVVEDICSATFSTYGLAIDTPTSRICIWIQS